MRNFRGPIQRYPGMPSSSDEDEDEEIDYYVQPVYHIQDENGEDSDDDDELEFNLVFNGANVHHVQEDDVIDVGISDLEEDDDDTDEFDTIFSFNSGGEPERIIINNNNSANSIDIHLSDVEMSSNDNVRLSSPHLDVNIEELEDDEEVDMLPQMLNRQRRIVVDFSENPPTVRYRRRLADGDEENNSSLRFSPIELTHNPEISSSSSQPQQQERQEEESSSQEYPEIEILRKPNNTPPPEETEPSEVESTTKVDDDVQTEKKTVPSPTTNSNLLNCDYSDSSCENTPRRREGETPNLSRRIQDEQESMDDDEDEDEEFCNPMISQLESEVVDENEDVLRGDRIGSTTYCERHVLKILMSWVAALPKLASNDSEPEKKSNDDDESEVTIPPMDRPLNTEFEESMSLLWDMTTEMDVMGYLIEKNIYGLVRDTLDTSSCPTRLKEISLGILANILSCSSILEEFPEKDDDLHLVERVIMEVVNSTKVPVLTQAFAVLRRVVCYIRNAKPLERWMKFLLHEEFINAANFLLASSTNVLLLGDVIMTLFTLMEVLSPPHEEEEKLEVSEEEKTQFDLTITKNFLPICQSNFVPSICEGLNELLKDSRTNADSFVTTAQFCPEPGKIPTCDTTGNGPDVYSHHEDDGSVVPPGHIQTSVLNGLASLCYLQKFNDGRNLLKQHSKPLMDVLVGIFKKFKACTEIVDTMETLDYFALAMNLLGFCHKNLDSLESSAITIPAKIALLLLQEEKTNKTDNVLTISKESSQLEIKCSQVSPYAVIYYDYLINLEEKFSPETIKTIIINDCQQLASFYLIVKQVAEKVQEPKNDVEKD